MLYNGMVQLTQRKFDAMVKKGNLDFKKCFFSHVKITGDLKRADFSEAEFSECQIKEADFQDANFSESRLYGGEVESCNFKNVSWTDATVACVVVKTSDFENVDFEKTSFRRGSFYGTVTMKDCNFANTYMDGTLFHMPPKNMHNPQNYETIKITMGAATDREIQRYKNNLLQVMGVKTADQKKSEYRSEHQEKRQEHNRSI